MAKTCSCGCGAPVFSKGLGINCWRRAYGKPIKKRTAPIARKKPIEKKPISFSSIKRTAVNKVSEKLKNLLDFW